MAATEQKQTTELILRVKHNKRSPSIVLASFHPGTDDATLNDLISARKTAEINRCHAAGIDTSEIEFIVGHEDI